MFHDKIQSKLMVVLSVILGGVFLSVSGQARGSQTGTAPDKPSSGHYCVQYTWVPEYAAGREVLACSPHGARLFDEAPRIKFSDESLIPTYLSRIEIQAELFQMIDALKLKLVDRVAVSGMIPFSLYSNLPDDSKPAETIVVMTTTRSSVEKLKKLTGYRHQILSTTGMIGQLDDDGHMTKLNLYLSANGFTQVVKTSQGIYDLGVYIRR